MIYFYPLLLLLLSGLFAKDPNHWASQVMLGEIGACIWLAFEINKRFSWRPALAFGYFSSYSIFCGFKSTHFLSPSVDLQSLFDGATGKSCIFLLLVLIPFVFMKKEELSYWLMSFKAFALIDCAYMIYRYLFTFAPNGWREATGMIGMDSVDGTFLGLMLPLVAFQEKSTPVYRAGFSALLIGVMLLTKSSTVFGLLWLELLVFSVMKMKLNKKNIALWALGLASIFPLGRLYLGAELLNGNGRFQVLQSSWNVFKHGASSPWQWLTGLGTSSWVVIMPFIQGTKQDFFIWLHNEPAQIFFEQGLIGILLLSSLYLYILKLNKRNVPMVVLIFGVIFQSFFQPCLRYFLFAVFIGFLTRIGLEPDFCEGNLCQIH